MERPKRVLCITDLASVGRASLAVATPVLAACGVQACPLPAALFSTHTGGFGEVALQDEAGYGEAALRHYLREGVAFDAVYAGYLLGEAQFTLARRAMEAYPGALHVVDPAVADNGRVYTKVTAETLDEMRKLCQMAQLITPNYTESALLLEEPPTTAPLPEEALAARLGRLAGPGRAVLVTSVPTAQGGMGIWGCEAGSDSHFTLPVAQVPQNYPGTGDLFTAAVVGLVLRGCALQTATERAAAFVRAAVQAAYEGGAEVRHGAWFEPFLPMLANPQA